MENTPQSFTSSDYERRIDVRPGIGATGLVRQRSRLRVARLSAVQSSIIVIVRGEKCLQQGDETLIVAAGRAICLDGGSYEITNRPASDGLFESFWLAWEPGQIAAFSARTHVRANCPQTIETIEPEFHATLMAARSALMTKGIPESIVRHRMEEVLWWLHEKGIAIDGRLHPTLTARVGQLMVSDPAHGWTLAAVSDQLAMGEATLRRRLAAEGSGFSDILIDSRMSLALTLLQCTDHPVNRIALEVGYDSASRFAVRFRKRFGFAPSEVRGHSR